MTRLLAICGSLRQASVNRAALGALCKLCSPSVRINVYEGLAALPAFNPDLDVSGSLLPSNVRALRDAVENCDGLVIAAPEYAHGVPGALKNALDWLVSLENFAGKPVMIVNCAPRAFHAQAALREILATMSGWIVGEALVNAPLSGIGSPTTEVVLARPDARAALERGLQAFERAIAGERPGAL